MFYRLAADAVVVAHLAYALFIVVGLLLILAGYLRRWRWVRNPWFRGIHLAMILVVVAESWLGISCPLTTWENQLRKLAGDQTYDGAFIANLVHDFLFFHAPSWVFAVIYTLFGLGVMLTFVLAPPRWKPRSSARVN